MTMHRGSRLAIDRWDSLMAQFGFSSHHDIHAGLIAAYSEKHRAYHTLEHIAACFAHLDDVRGSAQRPHEIELALWFHDAIYKPLSGTNEEDSAKLAKRFLIENAAPSESIDRIVDLIIMTKDHLTPDTVDAKLMLDIDLSILGAPPQVYDRFEKDVRKEYKRVPAFIFRKKRKAILQSFLNRPRVYNSDHFFDRLEDQARENLDRAILAL